MIKKEQVLEKALEMFNERGFLNVGMREIARELNLSPGNLTYHFSKKEDLLIALLGRFSSQNTSIYEDYMASPPTTAGFMAMVKKLFESQYRFRGVYIGNQFVRAELQSLDRFDYHSISAQRVATFSRLFKDLRTAGQINANEEDITFLVSYITLFGRFWISEATLFEKSPDKEKTIRHYLWHLAKQLALFATEEGKKGLQVN